jgi:UDP-2-acetamido-3-amino-2,3-dideoxy-glucuronate N-acetyltransferase
MTKIAVVGAGYWGQNLVRNIYDLGHLGSICDSHPQVLDKYKDKYPGIPGFLDYEEMLNDKGLQIDGVVIATPAETHHPIARRALLAGKHVFVEKPLATHETEGEELIKIAEESKKIVMVGHILQYHPAIQKLNEMIKGGELGKIQYIYSNRLNMGKIRNEENILWSFAPHDISVMLMLLGEYPVSVTSSGGNYVQPHIADVTMTTMEFPSGVKGHIFVSWLHPFKEQKLVVVGDKKMAVFDDVSEEKLFLYPHAIEWQNRFPVAVKAEAEIVKFEFNEPLKAECQHFIECISKGKKPKTDGNEGLRVLKVLSNCEASLRSNGIKIDLLKRNNERLSLPLRNGDVRMREYFVHESSYMDEKVVIGEGTKIWHYCHILKGSKIGMGCNIGQNVVIGPDAMIGNGCKIQNNVSVYKGVTLEDDVFCGPSMVFTNVFNPRAFVGRMDEIRPTLVKKGATIGANATIVCGVTIGRYAFVGAGSLVNKDVKDYAIVVGNHARRIGWMCECGVKLNEDLVCEGCGKEYRRISNEGDRIAPQ